MLTDNAKYGRLTAVLLIVWLAISITASKLLVFHAGSKHGGALSIPLGLAVLLPIAFFLLWFTASARFRQFVLSLNPTALTIAETWRIGGITFVTLQVFHILPGVFAQPAGWGDFFIGLTAPFVALYLARPGHKRSFIAWNIAGMLDLVNAIALGVLSSSAVGVLRLAVSTDAMTVLPLSLVPTFAVPLLFIIHIILMAQAMGWQTQTANRIAKAPARPSIASA
ncbi:MAG: hypothetical protein WCA16_10580 [Candidatus Sulfotelmatobacter sp.]